jgi:Zn-finger nucleic acid-binding protein
MKAAIYTHDCPECQNKYSVRVFIAKPEIWQCDRCRFWFERWELEKKKRVAQMSEPGQFQEKLVHTSAAIRISGDKQEIDLVINALARAGFFYKTNKTLYPCRDNPKRFNVYLNFVKCPALLEAKDGSLS